MSRAYRIKVRESLSRTLHGSDHVSTQLEVLGILPEDEMAALLVGELTRRGYKDEDGKLVRAKDGVTVTVEPASVTVTVEASDCAAVTVEGTKEGYSYDEDGEQSKRAKQALSDELKKNLQARTDAQEAELQSKVTDRLEAQLGAIRKELDEVATQVTGAALKKKAAQIGQIKHLSEDPQTGSMTIVLEV